MHVDLQSFYGVPGAILIESWVDYLRVQWDLPGKAAPLAAIVLAVAWNILLGTLVLNADFQSSVVSGLVTAMVASGWHEVTK